jgi:SCY1-like protein 2
MRGLPRILSQFPKSVLEKKVLPALLDENKDHELLSLTLQNVFKVLALVPNSKRAFSEKVLPTLREIFLAPVKARKGQKAERDTSTDGGLMVVMEQMSVITENCSGKEFKDDILPIMFIALESAQHSLQDAALHGLPLILPILDFSTLKNEVFPVVAHVFSKTSSLAIKISGLEAFSILCGGGATAQTGAHATSTTPNGAVLDKYTVQEKVVPLLKAIKTKEPAVMVAALNVFQQAGKLADIEFLASDILPCLYVFSLGPLLNLEQFQAYMTLIKSLSAKIEQEQTRKLQNLSSTSRGGAGLAKTNGAVSGPADTETDFESLVTGRKANNTQSNGFDADWSADAAPASSATRPRIQQQQSASAATFAWSTPTATSQPLRPQAQTRASTMAMQPAMASRTVTPDNTLSSFTTLSPARAGQPSTLTPAAPSIQNSTSLDWSTAKTPTASNWSTPLQPQSYGMPAAQATTTMYGQTHPVPSMSKLAISTPTIAPPPASTQKNGYPGALKNGQAAKQGMDRYESLL